MYAENMKTKNQKCRECDNPAEWIYLPECDCRTIVRYCCDKHVPRNCKFCNMDDDGKPLPKKEWQPCCEWLPLKGN